MSRGGSRCDEAVSDAVRARSAELAALCGTQLREVSIPDYTLAADVTMLLTVHFGVRLLLDNQLGTSPVVADGDPRMVRHFAQARSAVSGTDQNGPPRTHSTSPGVEIVLGQLLLTVFGAQERGP
ncbi:hypothetical protein OG705_36720 [Streptomyces sp. NBC_00838]|uniref:hypothetical protein n=1 Tax=Streptomyces sp. NBC_00838 TaxID=2903680 RepID=UPI003868C4EC|nr:hypothetical protein OG705_36720 [Streptomyces sp. NBC_00838]